MDNRYFFLFINELLFINKLYVIISVKWFIFAKKNLSCLTREVFAETGTRFAGWI